MYDHVLLLLTYGFSPFSPQRFAHFSKLQFYCAPDTTMGRHLKGQLRWFKHDTRLEKMCQIIPRTWILSYQPYNFVQCFISVNMLLGGKNKLEIQSNLIIIYYTMIFITLMNLNFIKVMLPQCTLLTHLHEDINVPNKTSHILPCSSMVFKFPHSHFFLNAQL